MDWMSFIQNTASAELAARNQAKADKAALAIENAKVSTNAPLGEMKLPAWVMPAGMAVAVLGLVFVALK